MDHIEIINELLKKLSPNITSYLEIGSGGHITFNAIQATLKQDIEPNPVMGAQPVYHMSSDDAFNIMPPNSTFDVVFIDGLHQCDQVAKDVVNASRHLQAGGYIILHDCMPKEEYNQVRECPGAVSWTGDVWKFVAWAVKRFSNIWTVPEDWGCGVIKGPLIFQVPTYEEMNIPWSAFNTNAIRTTFWENLCL